MSDDLTLEELLADMLDPIEALERAVAGVGEAASGEVDPEPTPPTNDPENASPFADLLSDIYDRLEALEGGTR